MLLDRMKVTMFLPDKKEMTERRVCPKLGQALLFRRGYMKHELRSALALAILGMGVLVFWYLFKRLAGYANWKRRAGSLLLGTFLIAVVTATMYVCWIRNWPSYEINRLLVSLIFSAIVIFLIPLGNRIFNSDNKSGSFKCIFIGTQLLTSACILAHLALAECN